MPSNYSLSRSSLPLNKIGVSVIICCYNSASRLPETLRYLSLQKVPANIEWEVVIVNNASTDNTVEIAAIEWKKHEKTGVHLRIIDQNIPGLSFAREKGVEESNYEYLIFCDDDNWLFENYIANAFSLAKNWSSAGIIGGSGLPQPEINPPDWFTKYSSYYATGCQSDSNGIMTGIHPYVYGAGMVVKKSVLTKLNEIGFVPLASDRKGEQLSSGGDVELCYAATLTGYNIVFDDSLKFSHFIPKSRLTEQYLLNLVYQFGYCDIVHRPYYWLFNPDLPKIKKTVLWTLLISLHIYLISLRKALETRGTTAAFICKVNLKHATGRLSAIISLNFRINSFYRRLNKKFKSFSDAKD
jgi:glycosyltransferase involved in cell wall biosynthesis